MTTYYHYNSLNEKQLLNSIIEFYPVRNCLSIISENIKTKEYKEKYLPLMFFMKFETSFAYDTKDLFIASNKKNIPNKDLQVYPIAVRYIDDLNTFYIERPPFKKEISFNIRKNHSIKTNIWIPWTLTVLNNSSEHIQSSRLYFKDSCLNNETDKYVPAFTPNIYQDGRICFSNSLNSYEELNSDSEIRLKYNIIFNEYMNGGWNVDLLPAFKPLYSAFATNNKRFKNYSMIDKFFNISKEEIHDSNPHLNIKTIESIFTDSDDYHVYSKRIFSSFFLRMSVFSLEETLLFYEQVINFLQLTDISLKTKSFQEILNISKEYYQHTYGYSQIFDKINATLNHSGIDKKYLNSPDLLKIIIKNYKNTPTLQHNGQSICVSLKEVVDDVFNLGYKLESSVSSSLRAEMLLTIVNNRINKVGTSIVECDLENNTITYLDENYFPIGNLQEEYVSYLSNNLEKNHEYVD